MKSDVERFLDKVTIGDGCWEWQASLNAGGYGLMRWNGQMRPAHRFAYELSVGAIPDGFHVDHLCRNPRCVRFDHLEAVTPGENNRRTAGWRRRKTHCPAGHAYTPENTGIDKGHAYCRECKRQGSARQYLKRKANKETTT